MQLCSDLSSVANHLSSGQVNCLSRAALGGKLQGTKTNFETVLPITHSTR